VRRLAILNHKGGVGKTTTCFNLACAYADQGLKVLCVDLDPQGHLALSFGITEAGLSGVDSLFFDDAELSPLLIEAREGIDLLPPAIASARSSAWPPRVAARPSCCASASTGSRTNTTC